MARSGLKNSAFLVAVFCAVPVFAACPNPSDMHAGALRFIGPSGESETFRSLGDTLVESVHKAPNRTAKRIVMANGRYVLSLQDRFGADDEHRTAYEFATSTSNMPRPFPLGLFRMDVEVVPEGARHTDEYTYQFGEVGIHMIGDCPFEVIPVTVKIAGMDGQKTYTYLPEFDLSFLSAFRDAEGRETQVPYIEAEAVP
ncbi:MAG: hypothetical protein ACRBCL_05915 [Maritimibacter sp.]